MNTPGFSCHLWHPLWVGGPSSPVRQLMSPPTQHVPDWSSTVHSPSVWLLISPQSTCHLCQLSGINLFIESIFTEHLFVCQSFVIQCEQNRFSSCPQRVYSLEGKDTEQVISTCDEHQSLISLYIPTVILKEKCFFFPFLSFNFHSYHPFYYYFLLGYS